MGYYNRVTIFFQLNYRIILILVSFCYFIRKNTYYNDKIKENNCPDGRRFLSYPKGIRDHDTRSGLTILRRLLDNVEAIYLTIKPFRKC